MNITRAKIMISRIGIDFKKTDGFSEQSYSVEELADLAYFLSYLLKKSLAPLFKEGTKPPQRDWYSMYREPE